MIRGILNRARGPETEDLVLSEVAVMEGFYVNIVSEARLLEAGVWYHGIECSLRYGQEARSIVLRQLLRKYNLVFLQYKPLSSCSSISSCVLTSAI